MSEDLYAAFLRCSEEELQNPELSLDRQLHNCQPAVAKRDGRIVATYYEIETGTSRYDQRGRGTNLAGYRIPIPRAGGLHELVADATRIPRPFDFVICENINRLARNPAVTFTVEEQLRAAGVTLLCADEPFEESFGSILLRHINVGLARGYHFDLMRKTREGRQSGTRQGWHMGGIPPYGYQFSRHEHPNPHKRSRGLTRARLDLDPVRAPVVRRIFDEYLYSPRGLDEICQLLNSDLDRFPPPVPTDPARRSGAWSRSSVWSILRNPKYTGFQVYNRRASKSRRGHRNDPEEWTWSTEAAHPAIVTTEEFQQVDAVAASKARSRRQRPRATRPQAGALPLPWHGPLRLRAADAWLPQKADNPVLPVPAGPALRPPAPGRPLVWHLRRRGGPAGRRDRLPGHRRLRRAASQLLGARARRHRRP
jgi:site-specific DNA recombinase